MKEILIDSVWKSFGQLAVLRGASLRLRQGEVTGMLGRNGTGKSTLLKILTGRLACKDKYIGVDGVFTRNLYRVPGLINYLPQHSCHPDDFSLHRLLTLYQVSAPSFLSRYADLIPAGDTLFGDLSGGNKRLFEVLRLLAAATEFTLLDEPFTHVMPIHVERLKQEIRQATARKGILVADHMYAHTLEVSDRLYLLHSGTSAIVEDKEDLVRLGYLKG